MSAKYKCTLLETEEMEALLDLQSENMKHVLAQELALEQGFLTFRYSSEMLKDMMADMPQPIVKVQDTLVGYALATSRQAALKNKLLAPAVVLTDSLVYQGNVLGEHPYYLMGQICVKKEFRSQGIFDQLYQAHKTHFSGSYAYLVTEIAVSNARSLAAHQRVGFKVFHQYSDADTRWNLVIWDWN